MTAVTAMSWLARLALLMAVVLTACAATPDQPAGGMLPDGARHDPGRYIVVTIRDSGAAQRTHATPMSRGYSVNRPYTASNAARSAAHSLASEYGLQEAASWPIVLLGVHCVVYEVPETSDRAALISRLDQDQRVESAQPLVAFTTQAAGFNDPYAGVQQSLAQMSVAPAQQWSQGQGMVLAVIDTGVDTAHPDLKGQVAAQRNFVDNDAGAFTSDLHGTAVAGVIAALANNRIGIAGVAPAVKLLALKACWQLSAAASTAQCNTFTLAEALAVAIDARADVVNLSLAGPADPLLTRLVQRGLDLGIVFVGAAPPSGARSGFPGNIPGVITVDAPGRRSGAAADLVAPGLDVLTLAPNARYEFASGSSLASAQVSAVAALLRAEDHRLSADDIRRVLATTSQPVSAPSGEFTSINACRALAASQGHGTCPPPGPEGLALENPSIPRN
jgi:subtilisin family serine protease